MKTLQYLQGKHHLAFNVCVYFGVCTGASLTEECGGFPAYLASHGRGLLGAAGPARVCSQLAGSSLTSPLSFATCSSSTM
ncbi:MAG: hypothetical protein KGI05_04705 [Thaumarchaeota archaeon]|nr:hypothetical protein [Nitrososphaerota archaeon]